MAVPDKTILTGDELRKQLGEETIAVYGFGRTGREVIKALEPFGTTRWVFNDSEENCSPSEWSDDINWSFGDHPLESIDRIITSPGVPFDHESLEEARARGIDVWGEVELAYRLLDTGTLWAVTGTNGKSTCTELAGSCLEQIDSKKVSVCGNRGTPLISAVTDDTAYDDYVVEISSFQVEGMEAFRPDGVLLTNLGDDHLDRHGSLEQYHSLKWELVERTDRAGRVVIPLSEDLDPQTTAKFADNLVEFSSREVWGLDFDVKWREDGLYLDGEVIGRETFPLPLQFYPENILSVIGLVLDRPDRGIVEGAVGHFDPLPHRAECMEFGDGPTVIEDSKATNPDAVFSLLDQIDPPFHLLLGGAGKDADFSELFERLEETPPESLAICGDESLVDKLSSNAEQFSLDVDVYERWEDAVKAVVSRAGEEESVLLSPGGTSFDAFADYKERGDRFQKWAKEAIER